MTALADLLLFFKGITETPTIYHSPLAYSREICHLLQKSFDILRMLFPVKSQASSGFDSLLRKAIFSAFFKAFLPPECYFRALKFSRYFPKRENSLCSLTIFSVKSECNFLYFYE